MKFTLSWLKEHLDTTATLAQITEALTDLGLEVEGVTDPAAKLATFTLARVLHAEQHPDADRLRVCRVMTDEGEKQIVCGAPNARAGITVVLAKPGDYVPGIDVTLGVGKIRGVESHGMMASERELELSDEHSGIIELPSGEVGERFVDWLAANRPETIDPVIEIKITQENDMAKITVFNTGTPIPEEDLPHIWEKFYKVDKARTREYGGNGIGLSIVKKIIEDHGGRIWASSKEGIGTEIHFVLRKYQEVIQE